MISKIASKIDKFDSITSSIKSYQTANMTDLNTVKAQVNTLKEKTDNKLFLAKDYDRVARHKVS